jgi:hypothetical protein
MHAMRCVGLPDGGCPKNRCDRSVKFGEGELWLCPDCDKARHQQFLATFRPASTTAAIDADAQSRGGRASAAAVDVNKQKGKKASSSSVVGGGIKSSSDTDAVSEGDPRSARSAASSTLPGQEVNETPPVSTTASASGVSASVVTSAATTATSTMTMNGGSTSHVGPATQTSVAPSGTKTIIDELLTYVVHYRDTCNSVDLHKLICHFYLPSEISASKAKVISEFGLQLSGCQHTTNRRDTSLRPAHDAEIADIIGMLELLDNLNVLGSVQFAAVSINRLPKYGPNEINVCSVVDRQVHIDKELIELKSALHQAATSDSTLQLADTCDKVVEAAHSRLTAMSESFNGQLQKLEAVCQNLQVMATAAAAHNTAPTRTTASAPAPIDDRSANVIIFGLAEDKNSSVWNATLSKVLQHVAGRPVDIVDAFRIGKFDAGQERPRPVIVKLRNIWDKRLLVSNARRLAEIPEFRRIGLAPDEPLEIRRKNTLKRLQYKATKDGKLVSVSPDGDCLYVGGVLVFSLSGGFIRDNASASISNSING